MKTSQIKPNPDNPRIIKDEKFRKLVESIRSFPEMMNLRPIVIDENNMVLGGNMRLAAVKELNWKDVPVTVAAGLTEDQKREFIIKDNIGFGEWDWDILANEWDTDRLNEWGLDLPLEFVNPLEATDDNYEIPDEIKTDIVAGDLFEIGQHRLLCGDSTNSDDVKKCFDGGNPILMVTDPPYGVNYDPNWRNEADRANGRARAERATGKVNNDDCATWGQTFTLSNCNVAYVWHAARHAKTVQQDIENAGYEIINQIIWAKNHIVISRGDYHWKHEPCLYAVKNGIKHNWQGSRKESTLWEIDKPLKSDTGHGTQKPIECMARPIRNNTYEKQSVYDPFLGSGTTMVAAHQLNRMCYGIEIDPKYCQVIIDRMLKLDPEIIIKKNGKPYIQAS